MKLAFFRETLCALILISTTNVSLAVDDKIWHHGASSVGELKYPAGFSHFDYVNPDAPKGGSLRLGATGSFDNLNPVPSKGDLAAGLNPDVKYGWVYESLLKSADDEISSEYGLLAEAFSHPDDYSSVTYKLRSEAKWQDGKPVTPEDVIFSFEKFTEHNPKRLNYYKHVVKAEKTGPLEITFTFDEKGNQELPHIVGQLNVLPKHWWEGNDAEGNPRDISATTLEPLMGSGPYRISDVVPGSSISFERNKDYWGEHVNVNVGHNNFDQIKYIYVSDRNVMFEAFKADEIELWSENEAKRWATGYDFAAVEEGRIKRETLPNAYRRSGILVGFLPNLKRDLFKDARVRRALNFAYDFEDQNRTLFFGAYERINSYFYGSELASSGLPKGKELEILENLRGQIPDEVFTQEYQNPVGGDPKKARANLRTAIGLLKEAGYGIKSGKMVDLETGVPFKFEILLSSPVIEKVALPYAETLKKIGLDVTVRTVDPSQYQNRLRSGDYDMIYNGWAQSLRPGNEQSGYWGSAAADRDGSENYMKIANPAIDELIRQIIFSKDRDELVAVTHALDRVLLANHFAIPTYTLRASRLAYWDRFNRPEVLPTYSVGFPDIWWSKSAE